MNHCRCLWKYCLYIYIFKYQFAWYIGPRVDRSPRTLNLTAHNKFNTRSLKKDNALPVCFVTAIGVEDQKHWWFSLELCVASVCHRLVKILSFQTIVNKDICDREINSNIKVIYYWWIVYMINALYHLKTEVDGTVENLCNNFMYIMIQMSD